MRQLRTLAVAGCLLGVAAGQAARAEDPKYTSQPRVGTILSAPKALPGADAPEMRAVSALIAQGRPEAEVKARWQAALAGASARETDIEALVQAVMQQAQQMQEQDLKDAQAEMARTNQQKAALRQQMQTLRDQKRDLEARKMEEKLNSVGDDAQLANVDMQNVLQKQQQTLQMMSNISKMLHDSAMSVVRKLGG
jgi:hypothetical protein